MDIILKIAVILWVISLAIFAIVFMINHFKNERQIKEYFEYLEWKEKHETP